MKHKDARNKIVNEVLQGIRVIKFFAWCAPLPLITVITTSYQRKRLNASSQGGQLPREGRRRAKRRDGHPAQECLPSGMCVECTPYNQSTRFAADPLIGQAVSTFFWTVTPLLVSVVTFTMYSLLDNTVCRPFLYPFMRCCWLLLFTANRPTTCLAPFSVGRSDGVHGPVALQRAAFPAEHAAAGHLLPRGGQRVGQALAEVPPRRRSRPLCRRAEAAYAHHRPHFVVAPTHSLTLTHSFRIGRRAGHQGV